MARVAPAQREAKPTDLLSMEVAEYARIKEEVDALSKRQKELRDSLLESIDMLGEPDAQGHVWLELPAEVGGVRSLQRQRRATPTLNQERAQVLLDDLGLTDECTKLVRVVDEDALMAAKWDGKITEEQLDGVIDVKVVWALHLK